ncbi:predicted protein [Naegleria gruberi]|uniref:Predicted protein n=1 Tax=Naegleria gruberi TaxID=5762 RepID=D2V9Y5_NAEGR|nr:uncharacterized protein NAEGRDRAFT_65672 [Naegleria gruberi]EFC46215.1 predicted protein [Naegleria gruberi]|eukprot:XP_002678959.1 predicted protein [Naegleria gruberi strain NEG-M]
MSTTESKSIFSRIISYITSWFMYIVQAIYSLYKDELERQSRDETDYKKWKLYEEIQRNQEQPQQYDEESVLGGTCPSTSTVSIQELKSSSEKEDETTKIAIEEDKKTTTSPIKQEIPVTSSVTEKVVEKEESPMVVIIKPKVVISEPTPIVEKKPVEQDNKPVITKPINPIIEETKKIPNETVIQSSPPKPVKEPVAATTKITPKSTSNSTNNVATQPTTTATPEKQSKPAEISGLIGERLKMKKFRNFSGNAYNSLIKPSSKEDANNKKEVTSSTITTPVASTQEVIQQSNNQLIQRKLSSKPKKVSRRPSQQTIKHSDILAKLEEEATIDLPDVEKFKELEEFSQLEKKVGLENAIKQTKEKKSTTAPPPPPLSQVVNVNTNDASPSKTKSAKVTLDAILNAKGSLRKTTEEWK